MKTGTFEQLPGLPGTGPLPEQFSATGSGTHHEGLVVKFSPEHNSAWVGNFQSGLTSFSGIFCHPNEQEVIVISGGQGYVIDPATRTLKRTIGGAIDAVYRIKSLNLLVFGHQGIFLEAIGTEGQRWYTRRLSWDGFEDVTVDGGTIVGKGWNVIDNCWQSFSVDLLTGRSTGGGYRIPDGASREIIYEPH
jgi:hypothetical protein